MKIFFRTATLLSALSVPFIASGCNARDKVNNVQVIKTKDILDKERNKIEKGERELASNLHKWASSLSDILWESYLVVDPKQGEANGVTCGRQLTKANDRFLGCDFLTVLTNKETIEEFDQVLEWSIRGANYMKKYIDLSEDALTKRLENGIRQRNDLQNLTYSEKEIKDAVQRRIKDYSTYKKSLPNVINQSTKLLDSIEAFNKDASLAKQPVYEPAWGLSIERLKSLKSLKLLN
ncbi:MAG: hypothetical protein HY094_05945 [Candidatus Melainabacteria bacterium]|nr:hypothetical protein [Candidatus Melainabacteria bacterium]